MKIALITICVMFYTGSVLGATTAMVDEDTDLSFALFILIVCPLVNTYIAIRYNRPNFVDIFKKLKEK